MNGCRLKIRRRRLPRPDGPVILRVQSRGHDDSIPGVLLAADKAFLGPRTCRIRFIQSLCFNTFKLLVNGPDYLGEPRPDRPEHETDTLWR
ncbi:hypothetical protein [Aquisphaera insulae]|uniref:hypothetical protein n=1 Tax=Aquisphaera insulae TaxID=2712864 RepID=UPI0013ECB575|nr:hypothetical protein [Aquisphaera insulae]